MLCLSGLVKWNGGIRMNKVILVIIILLLIWGMFFGYMVYYGEKLIKHPCQVCANKMGERYYCYSEADQITFVPNE